MHRAFMTDTLALICRISLLTKQAFSLQVVLPKVEKQYGPAAGGHGTDIIARGLIVLFFDPFSVSSLPPEEN